jgi:hypothetical protein
MIPVAATVGGRAVSKAFVVFSAVKLDYDGISYGVAIFGESVRDFKMGPSVGLKKHGAF